MKYLKMFTKKNYNIHFDATSEKLFSCYQEP